MNCVPQAAAAAADKAAAATAAQELLAGALWKAAQDSKGQAKDAFEHGYAAALAATSAQAVPVLSVRISALLNV